MQRRAIFAVALSVVACREGTSSDQSAAAEAKKDKPDGDADEASDHGKDSVAAADSAGAKAAADGAGDVAANAEPDAEPDPEPEATPSEAWLVWSLEPERTQWIEVADGKATSVASVDALVLSDGAGLWRVTQSASTVEMLPCECMEDPPPDVDCKPEEIANMPYLEATALPSGTTKAITEKSEGTDYGYDVSYGVSIVGGVGSTLFFESSTGGYFCGAHGMYETSWEAHDVAKDKPVELDLKKIGKELPKKSRTEAATEIQPEAEMCGDFEDSDTDGEKTLSVDDVLDTMELMMVSVSLDPDLGPELDWSFDYFLPYVCSPDYAAHGMTSTGLHAAATPLGLGPATPGLLAALGAGPSGTGGWAQITVTGKEREALLEVFRGARAKGGAAHEEPAAPSTPTETETDEVDTGKLLNDARRATRKGEYAEAIAALDKLLAADPEHARGWASRGYAKLLSGDLDGAKKDLQTASTKKKDDKSFTAAIHFNLGMLAEKQEDTKTARKEYQLANELHPSKPAQKALDRLAAPK